MVQCRCSTWCVRGGASSRRCPTTYPHVHTQTTRTWLGHSRPAADITPPSPPRSSRNNTRTHNHTHRMSGLELEQRRRDRRRADTASMQGKRKRCAWFEQWCSAWCVRACAVAPAAGDVLRLNHKTTHKTTRTWGPPATRRRQHPITKHTHTHTHTHHGTHRTSSVERTGGV